jgi:hypothetical protein
MEQRVMEMVRYWRGRAKRKYWRSQGDLRDIYL